MKCQDFSQLISAQLDGRLEAGGQRRLEAHLGECPSCCSCAADLQELRGELRRLKPPLPSAAMTADSLNALQVEAKFQAGAARRHEDRLEAWRVRIFAHGIGTVVSLLLLVFLTVEVLSPLHRTMLIARAMAETAVDDESAEFNRLSLLLLPPPPTRPNFRPSGELLGLSRNNPEGEFIIAVVVDKNGRASVKEIVEPPSDPAMVGRMSDVMTHQASFTPARREGKYIIADAVVLFSTVNIQG